MRGEPHVKLKTGPICEIFNHCGLPRTRPARILKETQVKKKSCTQSTVALWYEGTTGAPGLPDVDQAEYSDWAYLCLEFKLL